MEFATYHRTIPLESSMRGHCEKTATHCIWTITFDGPTTRTNVTVLLKKGGLYVTRGTETCRFDLPHDDAEAYAYSSLAMASLHDGTLTVKIPLPQSEEFMTVELVVKEV
jgi:hypothetical protein